jgi:deoxyribonuclease-4
MSIAGGVSVAIDNARRAGATALQLFLKNNNQWQGKPIAPEEAARFREEMARGDLAPPVAHSSYLINLASPDPELGEKSTRAMIDELERAHLLGVPGVVVHPGAHMGRGEAAGLAAIAQRVNHVLDATAGLSSGIWLETTAGQGTCLGWRFEHLAEIMARIEDQSRVAVCLDTCHIFAAGYELRTAEAAAATLAEFDRVVGLGWLRAIHVNDSLKPFGSRRDRHAHIGQGEIGEAGFALLLRDPRLRAIPFILETPKGPDLEEDRMNLATLRRLAAATTAQPRATKTRKQR